MLRFNSRRSAKAAINYYANQQEKYFSEGHSNAGSWGGQGAYWLGLSGEVDPKAFADLCNNLDPRTGKRLTLRTKATRKVGYDVNFHAPKSLSVLYLLNKDERIREAFNEAVQGTMAMMEQNAGTRVRRQGADFNRLTGTLAWATYIHHTARPVDGIPDPHLHAHCFVFNATYPKKNAGKPLNLATSSATPRSTKPSFMPSSR